MRRLTEDQKWELLNLMNRWRWGDDACDAKIERIMKVTTWEERA